MKLDRSYRMIRTILVVSSFCAFMASASGQERPEPAQKIRVGFFAMDGYHMVDADGNRSGYGYDLLQTLRPYTGWEYEYVGYDKGWAEMFDLLKRGEIDLLTNVSWTPEREREFDYSTLPIGYAATLLTVKAGCTKYLPGDYAHWNGMRIGLLKGTIRNESFAAFAKEKGFTYDARMFATVTEQARALQAGELDAIVTGSMREIGNEVVYAQLDVVPFYAVIRKGNARLLDKLNHALGAMFLDAPDKIGELRRKYYRANRKMGGLALLTPQERAFIARAQDQHRKFTVLVNPDRRPFSFFEDGKCRGMIADVLDLISRRTGLPLTVVPVADRADYRDRLARQQADIVADFRHDHNMGEKAGYLLTEPYITGLISELRRKDSFGIIRTAAVIRRSNMETIVRQQLAPGLKLVTCESSAEVIRRVKDGSVDSGYLFSRMASEATYSDPDGQLTFRPVPDLVVEFSMGLPAHADPVLVSIIAKAVNSLSMDDVQTISLAWTVHEPRPVFWREWVRAHYLFLISVLVLLVLFFGACFVWIFLLNRKSRTRQEEAEAAKRKAEEGTEWFRRTLNAIGDGVITTDARGRIIMLNPVGERMTGYKQAEIIGKPHETIFKIVRSADGEPIESPILRTLRTGVIVELANHTDLVARDGHRYHISDSSAPILDRSGAILGAILIFRDVTEQYTRTEQLRKALALMEAGSRLTHAATFEFDILSRRTTGSRLLPELWPIRDGRAVPPEEFVLAEDLPGLLDLQKRIIAGNLDEAVTEYRVAKPDGTHYYRFHIIVDERKAGNVNAFGIIQDITDIKQAELRLQDTLSLWKLVIDAIPVRIYVADADRNFTSILCNQALARFFGKEPAALLGVPDTRFFDDPDCSARTHRDNLRAMNAPEGLDLTEMFTDPHGISHYFRTIKRPLVEAGGRRLLVALSLDITESRRRAEYEALHNRILLKIIQETDFDKVIDFIARQLQDQIILCDHVILAKCDSAGLLRFEKEWRVPGSRSILEAGLEQHYKIWDVNIALLRQDKIFEIADMRENPLTRSLAFDAAYQTRSLIITPIFENGLHWGSLFVCSHAVIQNPELSAAQENLLRSCGNAIAIAAIRHRQESDKSRLLANERTIHYCLEALFNDAGTDDSIAIVLKSLARHFDAAGIYIHQILPEKHAQKIYAQYSEPGETPLVADTSMLIPWSGKERWVEHFRTNETLAMPDIVRPEQMDVLRDWQGAAERTHARSIYIARIMLDSGIWGSIGVLYRKATGKAFSPADFAMLKAAAHLVEIMLQRQRNREEIVSALAEARNANTEKTALLATEQTISACLATLFEEPDINKAMAREAELLRKFLGASHCHVLRYDLGQMTSRIVVDAAAPGSTFSFLKVPEAAIHVNERWARAMWAHQHHNIPDLRTLPVGTSIDPEWYQTIRSLNIRSLYLYPVFCQGRPWGNFGISYLGENETGLGLSAVQLRTVEVVCRMLELRLDREAADSQARNALA